MGKQALPWPGIIASLAMALPLCAPVVVADDPSAPATPIPASSIGDRLDARAEEFERLGLSGVIGVQRGDAPPDFVSLGLADRLSRTPNAPDTLYDIGLISTQFTAAAVLRLRMEGRLSLGTTLGDLFEDVPTDKAGITVGQLLVHRSGLPETVAMRTSDSMSQDRALSRIMRARLQGEPGEMTRFSPPGYTLLAMIVARVSGENFPDYIRREVFAASGMRDAHFLHDTELDFSRVAFRYAEPAGVQSIGTALTNAWSWETRGVTGGVVSARDLLAFAGATRAGDFFDEEARTTFWTPDSSGRSIGGLHFESMSGTTRILSSGQSTGFESALCVFPDDNLIVVMLANCNDALSRVGPEIERTVLFAPAPDGQTPEPSGVVSRLAGVYAFPDGSTMTLTPDGDTVAATARGQIALERLTHGDLFNPNWNDYYAQMNARAIDAARAIAARDAGKLLGFMERGSLASRAERLIDAVGAAPDARVVASPPWSLGTVTLADATMSFVELSDGSVLAISWRGRDLIDVKRQSPEQRVVVKMREIRAGVFEGPGADGVSAVRFSCEQQGLAPFDEIKLLATKNAGPIVAQRVEDE
ncbi:MAG: serine hydrolase [Phycisphaeraceae bacterium]|nr:serine hydrolase [Phycisphaerales bacterium]MCB9843342.1 serine hydrolase [Phycisphaeraceae bacterium]